MQERLVGQHGLVAKARVAEPLSAWTDAARTHEKARGFPYRRAARSRDIS
jgi:hypothetical protein